METSSFIIYGLIDPRNGQLRYVGKSARGLRRVVEHSEPGRLRKDQTHKAKWIRSLRAVGLRYGVEVLERCETAEALGEAERHQVGYFRFIGADLTNHTDGGEGNLGWVPSAEFRANLSRKLKGKKRGPLSAEHRANLSKALKGREVWSKGQPSPTRGVARTEEVRERISRSKGGHPVVVRDVRYPSLRAAARALGVNAGNLWKVLEAA